MRTSRRASPTFSSVRRAWPRIVLMTEESRCVRASSMGGAEGELV